MTNIIKTIMSQQLNDFLQKIHNKIAMLNEYNTQTYRNHAQYILSWHQIELILQSNVNLSFNCHRRSFYQQTSEWKTKITI